MPSAFAQEKAKQDTKKTTAPAPRPATLDASKQLKSAREALQRQIEMEIGVAQEKANKEDNTKALRLLPQ